MPKLSINNTFINFDVLGQGEPLLFIHGLASSSRSWKKQIPFFCKRYQVITFDIRGHGLSDRPVEPYSIELFASDAHELLRILDVAPAHVVGFSMGGMVAFQLAVDAPETVRSLVAVNCCPEGSMRTFNNGVECVKHLVGLQINDIKHRRRKNGGEQRQEDAESEPERAYQSMLQRMAVKNKLAYANAFSALVKWSVADRLHTIKCPTLMITADEDFVPVSIKESYASKMPSAKLVVINNSRHSTPKERTEEFNDILLEFVSSH